MAVYLSFLKEFFTTLRADNSIVDLDETDVTVGKPTDIRGTPMGIKENRNTKVMITFKPTGRWQGKRTLRYNRHHIKDLHTLIGDTLSVPHFESIEELIPLLNDRYGTTFTKDDLANDLFYIDRATGHGKITLSANPSSYSWIGSAVFNVVPADIDLLDVINDNVLDGIKYPNGQMGHENPSHVLAQAILYPLDFSKYYDTFSRIAPSQAVWDRDNPVGKAMVAALNGELRVNDWNLVQGQPMSLYGSIVDYVGENQESFPTNSNRELVIRVVPAADNKDIKGPLYFTYSRPAVRE
ncbi:MAG: hypothetical protein ACRDBQ_19035 [Shewanella sp.]